MILINKLKNGNVEITGHANSDVYGKDLVCCAVSVLVQSVANFSSFIEINGGEATVLSELAKRSPVLRDYLNKSLTDLANQFPDNIKIVEGDVE
jgi:uncharacterized protein YsxB (DUF464 family)